MHETFPTGEQRALVGEDSNRTRYDRLAPVYDFLASAYTCGGILRTKSRHLTAIEPGNRVLYLGAGTAHEALMAAQRGADVTILDRSVRMLGRARKRFLSADSLNATFLRQDALEDVPGAPFDVVVLPFFLNVFGVEELGPNLRVISRNVRPGGLMISADFRGPVPSPFRHVQRMYYLPPLLLFSVLANNPWHPLYDYESIATLFAPDLRLVEKSPETAWGLPLLEQVTWRKV